MSIGRSDKIIRGVNGEMIVKPQFSFGNKVVLELVTKEDPMTPDREAKIRVMKQYGYDVVVFDEDVFSSFETFDAAMAELTKKTGDYNKAELDKYKEKRRENFNILFGDRTFFRGE